MNPKRLKTHKNSRNLVFFTTLLTKLFRSNRGLNKKLQYEYAGSYLKFDELQFNLFVAGEWEIISTKKIDEIKKKQVE